MRGTSRLCRRRTWGTLSGGLISKCGGGWGVGGLDGHEGVNLEEKKRERPVEINSETRGSGMQR